jgi:hypothetical protein
MSATSFIVVFPTGGNTTKAYCGSVSGTTITLGTITTLANYNALYIRAGFMLSATSFFVATSTYAMVGTISGVGITPGNAVVVGGGDTYSWLAMSASIIISTYQTKVYTYTYAAGTLSAYVETDIYTSKEFYGYEMGYTGIPMSVFQVSSILFMSMFYSTYLVGTGNPRWELVAVIFDISSGTLAIKGFSKLYPAVTTITGRMSSAILMGTDDLVLANVTERAMAVLFLNKGGWYLFGIAETSQTAGQTVNVILQAGKSDIFAGLLPGKYYYADVNGNLVYDKMSQINHRRILVGQACSSTSIARLFMTPDIYHQEAAQI